VADKGRPGGPRSSAEGDEPRSRGHVLIVDDEEAILQPTARYFRALGFTVDTAQGPHEAEALVDRHRYDLAILDLRLTRFGGADGLEVVREIRARSHGTSIVVLTAYISPQLEAEARALGADSVVCKPQPLPDLAQLALVLIEAGRE
jgi:DNA-binding response OmpR family regulator